MSRLIRRTAILWLVALMGSACGSEPAATEVQPVNEVESGPQRIEWDQPALEGTDVASYRFVLDVDGVENELPDATCGELLPSGSHLCDAVLPTMSAGRHVATLVAFYEKAGKRFESRRSVSLEFETR